MGRELRRWAIQIPPLSEPFSICYADDYVGQSIGAIHFASGKCGDASGKRDALRRSEISVAISAKKMHGIATEMRGDDIPVAVGVKISGADKIGRLGDFIATALGRNAEAHHFAKRRHAEKARQCYRGEW